MFEFNVQFICGRSRPVVLNAVALLASVSEIGPSAVSCRKQFRCATAVQEADSPKLLTGKEGKRVLKGQPRSSAQARAIRN